MIIVVMGIAGSGKTTLGRALADALGWGFMEGDDYHPQSNRDKMASGIPLSDRDRLPWLDRLRDETEIRRQRGDNTVLSCSALRREYRTRLSNGHSDMFYVYLHGERSLVRNRLETRRGHFMNPELLDSQLADLEPPEDALWVPMVLPTSEQVELVLQALEWRETE